MPELTMALTWTEGWIWVLASLFLAVLWANLAWFFRNPRSDTIDASLARLVSWQFSPFLFQCVRLFYYIGLPFAALLWGHDAVVARWLGLQRLGLPVANGQEMASSITVNWPDWAYDVGWMVVLGVGVWMLLALGWGSYRRALTSVEAGNTLPGAHCSGWLLLREAAFHEVHWAFYRSVPIVALGQYAQPNKYWGTWAGLALVTLEAVLNPAWREGLTDPQRAPSQLMRGVLAIVSSVLFLQTENLWLALVLHWMVSWGLAVPNLSLR